VRFSMLPIAMATVYLFHQILLRFGISSRNAAFGALTLGLSPLFLLLASSYMSDVPGLLVILICIYMCQRAVAARTDRAALLWLVFAMLVNVAGGTVRQIAWLGALVMVPSTAWLLRQRRGMKAAGVLLWIFTLIGVLACMHWFKAQPYSLPDFVLLRPIHARMLFHLSAQLTKALLCLLLITFPVLVAWLPIARQLSVKARLRLVGVLAVYVAFAIALHLKGDLIPWVAPWLTFFLEMVLPVLPGAFGMTAATTNFLMALGISLLVLVSAITLVERLTQLKQLGKAAPKPRGFSMQTKSWRQLAWILGPFFFSYFLLLVPSGIYDHIQDKYLLGLFPVAIIVLLKLYQERVTPRLSVFSLITLVVFTFCAVCGSHDIFAESRALVRTIGTLRASGVPRASIVTICIPNGIGLASDGWAQIEMDGYINDPRVKVPAGAYNPHVPDWKTPTGCQYSWHMTSTPALVPRYIVVSVPLSDLGPTKYPPLWYGAWLPPFHRALYVQQLKETSN